MQYVLDQGQRDDWFSDPSIQLCTLLASCGRGAFVWWELRVAQPIVDLRVLRQPAVAAALSIAGAFAGIIFPSTAVAAAVHRRKSRALPARWPGCSSASARCRCLLLTMPVARLIAGMPRFDLRWAIGGGLAVAGLGIAVAGLGVTTQTERARFASRRCSSSERASAFVYSPLLVATMRAVRARSRC